MSISINPINNNNYKTKNVNFSGDSQNKPRGKNYYTYVSDKHNPATTPIWATVATYLLPIFGTSFLSVHFASKYIEKNKPNLKNKGLAIMGISLVTATIAAVLAQNLIINKKKLKPISKEEQIEKEKQIQKVVADLAKQKDVKLNGVMFYDFQKNGNDTITNAGFDQQTGYLILNSKFKDTNLEIKEVTPLIVHELTHAKQFENIAKTQDGLIRINKILLRSELKLKKQNEIDKILATDEKDLPALAKINIHKTDGTYTLTNEELDEKCEIKKLKAIKMYLKNPDTPPNELPMMVNEDYYKTAIKGKPPLTEEESKKVESYLSYMESDKFIDAHKGKIGKSLKTTTAYFDNPIEKEAYTAQFEYIKTGKVT